MNFLVRNKIMSYTKNFIARVERDFQTIVQDKFEVLQIHKDGDVCKMWRCGKPTSSNHVFFVCSVPNALIEI